MLTVLLPSFLFAQSNKRAVGDQYLLNNQEELGLSNSDLSNLVISDMYMTKHNGVTHIYYQQSRSGIPVYNAILNLNITKEDKMIFHANTYVQDLDSKINTTEAIVNPEFAVKSVASKIGVISKEELNALKSGDGKITYAETSYSHGNIEVKQMYYAFNDNDVRLVWDVTLDEKESPNIWNSKIDAVTGEVIGHKNMTIFCTHAKGAFHNHNASCQKGTNDHKHNLTEEKSETVGSMLMGDTYRVYPFPTESPAHGNHELVTDPHFPAASPFGWHDIDGIEGPEFAITRGNNVHAFQNESADGFSQGDEPSGVPSDPMSTALNFDFPVDLDAEPEVNVDADVVNLFYANNYMHDVAYLTGFDEAAGNYQLNNYGNGGQGNDAVNAFALDGTSLNGGAAINNAYFGPRPDGTNGTMGMFRWTLPAAGLFSLNSPAELEGSLPNGTANGGAWGFDETYSTFDITAELAQALDGSPQSSINVCDPVINPDEINGKIAMIYRGLCEFGVKAFNAQEAGAVAVIICNVPGAGNDPTSDGNQPMGMGAGARGGDVTIPTFSLGFGDCNRIVASLDQGVTVSGTIRVRENTGPAQVSSGFDNGIIAHEYGHGISARLTGGPSTTGCLGVDEQMGEGWSDFFGLVTTVEPGDQGTDARGIGNFVIGSDTDGPGIRRSPYSTDRNINNQTFNDIKATTAPHPLGEVWTTVLWDIFWAYIDIYGWDADWNNTESGNFRAVQLVMDGMKMQGCNPGFIRGRDALLAAEQVSTNGENQCVLWDVFAARGLGFFADGGSPDNRNDNVENFDALPSCLKTLKIYKDVTSTIAQIDEPFEITLTAANHKDEMVNATVSDMIPDGMTFIDGSSNIEGTVMNGQVFFTLDNLASGETRTITYSVSHDNTINSEILFTNQVETTAEVEQWDREFIPGETNIFRLNSSTIFPNFSGESGWFVPQLDEISQANIKFNNISVSGGFPVLRFYHRINTEFTRNGGFVEISTDGDLWFNANDLFIRNGPECPIQFTTFAIPALQGFSGQSGPNDFIDSYLDLSSFNGQTISLRFRFGTDDGGTPNDEIFDEDSGWFIDDIDLIDLVNNDTEACITTVDDAACTIEPIIFDPQLVSSTQKNTIEGLSLSLFPNPANDFISLDIFSEKNFAAKLSILSVDGKQVLSESHNINAKQNFINLNTSDLSPGIYIIQLLSENGLLSQKVIIQ